jgi:hypothetical protein
MTMETEKLATKQLLNLLEQFDLAFLLLRRSKGYMLK